MINTLLGAITAACLAYAKWVEWQRETQIDEIEDEMDQLAARGDAASKLRLERLHKRKLRKLESIGTV